jgi:hypothetical protein
VSFLDLSPGPLKLPRFERIAVTNSLMDYVGLCLSIL